MLIVLAWACCAQGAVVEYTFDVRDWVVDFLRPTKQLNWPAERQTPYKIPAQNRKGAILINGEYPGTPIEAFENDTVVIHVLNHLISEATSIHWHGVHPYESPWTDGAIGVTQAAIPPGGNFTYRFKAWPSGTHYWHSHMDGMQSAKGMRGAVVVKRRDDPERYAELDLHYDQEQLVVLSDEWRDPEVCLKLEGAFAGNDVCSDIQHASLNGQVAWGDNQKPDLGKYPYPLIDVKKGLCYRLRLVMMASNAENFIVTVAGHNMTLIALDGVPVKPIMVSSINMHIGERADVILCVDQEPGYYPIELKYDYACPFTKFTPPGFGSVSSCQFFAFLHYKDEPEVLYGPPNSPKGTGGGRDPKPVGGVRFDLTDPDDWNKTHPVERQPEPEDPDARSQCYTFNICSDHPSLIFGSGLWCPWVCTPLYSSLERSLSRANDGIWTLMAGGRPGESQALHYFTRAILAAMKACLS